LNKTNLQDIKKSMMTGITNPIVRKYMESINVEIKRPLGKFNIWAWWVELVRGCNLACWHCPTRLLPKNKILFMTEDVWLSMLKVIKEVTPRTRLEFGNAGEPTLHPALLEYLKLARKICPDIQILTYTNGTKLIEGSLTYKQLFDAGLNRVFVDMYSPYIEHKKLAKESGYSWFYQDTKSVNDTNVFSNCHKPDSHIIMLAENPSHWSHRKLSRGYLSTFFNDLDWSVAIKHGLKPTANPIERKCDLPFKFINVNYDGSFVFCCFDYMRHTIENFGNINEGLEAFINFWFGKYMQNTRKNVADKNRKLHEYCAKCSFTSVRCDIPCWSEEVLNQYWKNNGWHNCE